MSPEHKASLLVIVWGRRSLTEQFEHLHFVTCVNTGFHAGGFIRRTLWQIFLLDREVKRRGCDILLVPGGVYVGNFKQVVAISQNLLPFDPSSIKRYGWNPIRLKWVVLAAIQRWTFRRAAGVVFLTDYAHQVVSGGLGRLRSSLVVPHGVSVAFLRPSLRHTRSFSDLLSRKIKIVYVSTIEFYKNQISVVRAVDSLRRLHKLDIQLSLVGPSFAPALRELERYLVGLDDSKEWIQITGVMSESELVVEYTSSDIGVFASSCENLPIILLEMMASGIPIACSAYGPMPSVLLDGGLYFNPEDSVSIELTLERLIRSEDLRHEISERAVRYSQRYDWKKSSSLLFDYIINISNTEHYNSA